MRRFPTLVDTRVIRPSEAALSLGLVTELELLRLKAIARWYARGLPPDLSWEDLLQEALTRVLVGSRRAAVGVTAVAFLAGVMRSLRSEHWRRIEKGARPRRATADRPRAERASPEVIDWASGPERALLAQDELNAIRRLFAKDPAASIILSGLERGLTAVQIRLAAAMTETEYASARKRMRRLLLREGLTCTPR